MEPISARTELRDSRLAGYFDSGDSVRSNILWLEKATQRELAIFVALCIDTEGTITVIVQTKPREGYFPRVSFVNMNKALVLAFEYAIYRLVKAQGSRGKYNRATNVVYSSQQDIYDLITTVKDFLIVKKDQADLMLRFLRCKSQGQFWIAESIKIAQDLRRLNH